MPDSGLVTKVNLMRSFHVSRMPANWHAQVNSYTAPYRAVSTASIVTAINAASTIAAVQSAVASFGTTYGMTIVFETTAATTGSILYPALTSADLAGVKAAAIITVEEYSKYPPAHVLDSTLTTLRWVKSPATNGGAGFAGLSFGTTNMLVVTPDITTAQEPVRFILHHEFQHMRDASWPQDMSAQQAAWEAANSVPYGSASTLDRDHTLGFVRDYAMTSYVEDRAEVHAYLMVQPRYNQLMQWTGGTPLREPAAAVDPSSAYRYYRFRPTTLRTEYAYIQMGEFELLDGSTRILGTAPANQTKAALVSLVSDVTTANGYIYTAKDSSNNTMDTLKVIDDPSGGYFAVYHTGNVVRLARSTNMLTWTSPVILDSASSQPTIKYLPTTGGFLVGMEFNGGSGGQIRIKHYTTRANLLANVASHTFTATRQLSPCNEGTPHFDNVVLNPDINNSVITIGMHHHECDLPADTDRQSVGTLTNFTSWSSVKTPVVSQALIAAATAVGQTVNGNVGDRDNLTWGGVKYGIHEVQYNFGPTGGNNSFASWRAYLYDYATNSAQLLNIRTHRGSTAFANPSWSLVTSPTGQPAIVVCLFIPSEAAGTNEAGPCIFWKALPPGPGVGATQKPQFWGLTGPSPAGQEPAMAADNSLATKWLSRNGVASILTYDMGAPTRATGYRWATGNDFTDRDPVSWVVEGSQNGTSWTFLHDRVNYATPTARNTYIPSFTWGPPTGPPPSNSGDPGLAAKVALIKAFVFGRASSTMTATYHAQINAAVNPLRFYNTASTITAITAATTIPQVQSAMLPMGNTYGITFGFPTTPNVAGQPVQWGGTGLVAGDLANVKTVATWAAQEISKYPPQFMLDSGHVDIWYVKPELTFNGQPWSGSAITVGPRLYIEVAAGAPSESFHRYILHHELQHSFDDHWVIEASAQNPQWDAANPTGFIYGAPTVGIEEHPPGFVRGFSQLSRSEDRADVAAWLMTTDLYDDLQAWIAEPPPPGSVVTRLLPTNVTQASMNATVLSQYNAWKTANLVQSVPNGWWAVRANAPDAVYVAEGQGYGLMLLAQMSPVDAGAKAIFDGITEYVLDHPSTIDSRLHASEQNASFANISGGDCATDGDMDIAMGHLMAHRRWGSAGTYNYLQLAQTRIAGIKAALISPTHGLLRMGDWSSGAFDQTSRTSDWMIGHFEAFRLATGDTFWVTCRDTHLTAVERLQNTYAASTGLLPDFTTGTAVANLAPGPANVLEGPTDTIYSFNACRTPWRLSASDHTRSVTAARKINTFARSTSGGTPTNFRAGYQLNGTVQAGITFSEPSFLGPVAAAATLGTDQAWVNSLWTYMAGNTTTEYYGSSLRILAMIQVSRTYWMRPDLSLTVDSGADTTAPTVPTGLNALAVSTARINLTWTASTDNIGVAEYWVYRGGVKIAEVTGTSYSDLGLSPSTLYSYQVRAVDAVGNESALSTADTDTTFAAPTEDVTKPTIPTGLDAVGVSATQINLTWNPSTDAVGVVGYTVRRNNLVIALPTTTFYSDTGRAANTSYTYTVSARDAAGNESDPSVADVGTTQPVVSPPPVGAPVAVLAVATVTGRTVVYDTSGSGSTDGAAYVRSIAWGDGTTTSPAPITGTHTYAVAASYVIVLTVTSSGQSTTTSRSVSFVGDVPPPVDPPPGGGTAPLPAARSTSFGTWEIHPRERDLSRLYDPISRWTKLTLVERFNQPATWTIDGPADALAAFTVDGGCVLDCDGLQVASGTVQSVNRSGEMERGRLVDVTTVVCVSDLARVGGRVVFPEAGHVLSGVITRFPAGADIRSGSVESVILGLLDASFGPAAQAGRRITAVEIPPSFGRGGDTVQTSRLDALGTLVQSLAEVAGLRVEIAHTENPAPALRLSVTATTDRSLDIRFGSVESASAGVITEYSYEVAAPTVTRAIVAGGGELEKRTFLQVVDAEAEALWGMVREVVVDQRQADPLDDFHLIDSSLAEMSAIATAIAANRPATVIMPEVLSIKTAVAGPYPRSSIAARVMRVHDQWRVQYGFQRGHVDRCTDLIDTVGDMSTEQLQDDWTTIRDDFLDAVESSNGAQNVGQKLDEALAELEKPPADQVNLTVTDALDAAHARLDLFDDDLVTTGAAISTFTTVYSGAAATKKDGRIATTTEELTRAGNEALIEGAGPRDVRFTVAPGPDIVYRRDFLVGDIVGYDLPGLEPAEDRIREVTTEVTVSGGQATEKVTLTIGTPEAGKARAARQVASALRRVTAVERAW